MKNIFTLILIIATTALSFGQTINSSIPKKINKSSRYMFYLHGRIIEEQGPTEAVHPQFGRYEYGAILDTLKNHGFTVISEARPKNTDVKLYAEKISKQIDTLLHAGVRPNNIFVLGASKGAFITLWISTLVKNNNVNFIVIGTCSDESFSSLSNNQEKLCGNFLSFYESSDTYASSCMKMFANQPCVKEFKEVELKMNIGHGFLYKPYKEWIDPLMLWANEKH